MKMLISESLARFARGDVVFWIHDESPEDGTLDATVGSGSIDSVGRGAHGTEYLISMTEPERKFRTVREKDLYRTRKEVETRLRKFKEASSLSKSKPR